MCMQILLLPALWSAYGNNIACWSRCRLRGGGLGVNGCRFWHYDFCTFCSFFYDILSDLDVILLHLRFLVFLWHFPLLYLS